MEWKLANVIEGRIDPARVLEGLAASGYTPESAICDIVDNSVTWRASRIRVRLESLDGVAENRANNAKRYVIADNGQGMDRAGLENALALGSVAIYPAASLSKFGLGLKSAAFSQGRRLEIWTRASADAEIHHACVDLDKVQAEGKYTISCSSVPEAEFGEWSTLVGSGSTGTVVVIEKIRTVNHPSVRATREVLHRELGRIYQFFLERGEDRVEILLDRLDGDAYVSDSVEPFDPLFVDEAMCSKQDWAGGISPITRGDWDGQSVQWLQEPVEITLDAETSVRGVLEITQLPHPPSFGGDGQRAVREKYSIAAGEYGVYVYRNKRLISKADHLDGLIPMDQDFYSFRARLEIDETADEALNIDLKKSRILLSSSSHEALSDFFSEPKRQSKEAWNHRKQEIKRQASSDADSMASELLADISLPETLPTDSQDRESEVIREEREAEDRDARELEEDEAAPGGGEEGAIERPGAGRVIFVPQLGNNVVWERAYDPALGVVVRLNSAHRFVREVRERLQGPQATFLIHVIFLALANGESHTIKSISNLSTAKVEQVLSDLRNAVSSTLYHVMQDVADGLDSLEG